MQHAKCGFEDVSFVLGRGWEKFFGFFCSVAALKVNSRIVYFTCKSFASVNIEIKG